MKNKTKEMKEFGKLLKVDTSRMEPCQQLSAAMICLAVDDIVTYEVRKSKKNYRRSIEVTKDDFLSSRNWIVQDDTGCITFEDSIWMAYRCEFVNEFRNKLIEYIEFLISTKI